MSFNWPVEGVRARRDITAAQDDAVVELPLVWLRRLVFFGVVFATILMGVEMMFNIVRANGVTVLQGFILVLFTITFAWIAVSFWTAVIGFVLQLLRLDPLSLRAVPDAPPDRLGLTSRTALLMPIYNEEPMRVMAGLEATCRSLTATGQADAFDVFVLSDTTDPDIARAEEQVFAELSERLTGEISLYYRRRQENTYRKAGNIADFCRRWGLHYDYMVVMDADSIMSGATLVELARSMEANPRTGLIQTVPIAVRQRTLFGRFLQFAGCLYSPMLATGFSFWQADAANYWGHNAIMRVEAFTQTCGLPTLPGRPPLGGEILSHDFVEAALMRRGGWQVRLMPYVEGSYEELPGNMLDFAKRDRRWTQGNLQHLRLLGGRALHPLSRLHFLLGALAYISSLLWLMMLSVSTVDAIARAVSPERFFGTGYQLFPDWPIAKTGLIFSLLAITLAMLLLPKAMGMVLALLQRRREFGGGVRLVISGVLEVLFSILIAPVMMAFHAWFVISVLVGRNISWGPQVREGRPVPWVEAFQRTGGATLIGLIWGGAAAVYSPQFFWWLTPVLLGLLLAAPIVRFSSSLPAGLWMRRWGLLLVPSESQSDDVLIRLEHSLNTADDRNAGEWNLRPLPPELPRPMPTQSLR